MSFIQNVELSWTDWKTLQAGVRSTDTVYYLQNDLQYVPFIVQADNSQNDPEYIYYTNVNRDPSSVSGPYAALSSGAKASKVIQDITYAANAYGTGGNSITIQYTNDASAVGEEYVTVSGNAIVVHIVSGSSTAQQVLSAVVNWSAYNGLINHSQVAAQLISAIVTGSNGTAQTTQGPTALTGGVNTVTVLSDWETNYKSTATLASSFMNAVAEEIA